MAFTTIDLSLCVVATIATVLLVALRKHTRTPYPPGPKGLPLLGCIFAVPQKRQWLTYQKWSEELNSPIIHFKLLGTSIIVLNDADTAHDLFDKRAEIYSERPRLAFVNEGVGFDWNFGVTPDSKFWRVCRREFEARFRQIASRTFRDAEVSMAHGILRRFLDTPEDFMRHLRYMTGSLILDVTYGISVKPEHDKYIEIADRAQEAMDRSMDANIIDIIPWVQYIPSWLPGMGWKKEIDDYKEWTLAMLEVPFQYVKEQLERGVAKPCITTDLLEKCDPPYSTSRERELVIKSVAATAYSAGSDTTVASLTIFVFVMMLFPNVQQKAQEQLDRVVGCERLPTFRDIEELPYITAIIREIMRWTTFVPTNIPHQTASADIYRGYYIPKGAVVIANAWAILYDSKTYSDPDRFMPERFLTTDGKLDPNVSKPDSIFGFGRRICPGRFMAIDSVWITIACLLATFTFSMPQGESVKPADKRFNPDLFQSGLVGHPLPFNCDIRPRSAKAAELIRATS